MATSSIKRKQPTEENREAKRSLMKREKSTGSRTDSCKLRTGKFCYFQKPRKRPCQKEKVESNEQTKEGGSRNMFLKKGWMPDRVKSLKKVDRSKNRLGARLGFVKAIRSGLERNRI